MNIYIHLYNVECRYALRRGISGEIGNLLPNNRRQRRTCYALCHILYPVSAAHTSIFRMDSNSTSGVPRLLSGISGYREQGGVFSSQMYAPQQMLGWCEGHIISTKLKRIDVSSSAQQPIMHATP